MAYQKNIMPIAAPSMEQVSSDMAGIGMNINAPSNFEANIEDTLVFASIDGMDRDLLRTLAVMTHWLHFHSRIVNVDRLTRLIQQERSVRVRVYWASIAKWKNNDPRFRKLAKVYKGQRIDLTSGTGFHVMRHGEDERFKDGPLRVPANVLRQRDRDIWPIEKMQERNLFVRYRLIIGPVYRADMWAMLDLNPELTTAELARRTYGSFSTAWNAHRDWRIVNHA